jgi:hypothetical protein
MQKEKKLAPKMKTVLDAPFATLKPEERVFLVVLVVTRFRNNIFHGTKEIPSWPKYKPELAHCTAAMQSLVSHQESITPSLSHHAIK